MDYVSNELIANGDDGYTSGITILNKKGPTLPETGGMGTVLFTAGGLMVMAFAIVLALSNNKKTKAKN